MMKTFKALSRSTLSYYFIVFAFLLCLLTDKCHAQDFLFDLGASSRNFTYGSGLEWNMGIKSKYNFLKFSLQSGFGFNLLSAQSAEFTTITTTRSFSGELRYFPFVKNSLGYGCLQANYYERLPSFGAKLAYGLYIAPGFQYNANRIVVTLSADLESPIPTLTARVQENNLTLFLGYQAKISFLSLGVAYGVSIGKVALQDEFDILKEEPLYTSSFPIDYRLTFSPRFSVGVNF